MDSILITIADVIEEIADIPKNEISPDSGLIDDLDLSSLEIMSIISEIEHKYSIKITEDELLSIMTVEELAKIINYKRTNL